jgi:hypothetical protein
VARNLRRANDATVAWLRLIHISVANDVGRVLAAMDRSERDALRGLK